MFIILPNKIDGMAALEAALTEDTFLTLDRKLQTMEIEVALPKFKVKAAADIKTVLTKMGISDLFDRNVADLSGISGRDELFVSDVFHKAFVEVNEEGSEAAAATGFIDLLLFLINVSRCEMTLLSFFHHLIDNESGFIKENKRMLVFTKTLGGRTLYCLLQLEDDCRFQFDCLTYSFLNHQASLKHIEKIPRNIPQEKRVLTKLAKIMIENQHSRIFKSERIS